ncbi:hypothetical protein EXU48_15175 [Occultella glacieicola]|uniref:Uncharacterized protein n=1 Tax=Occultella glacieicola TaxID=2518684 RepID=A0ABY2E131_9MICO|nr:hypothetical protein [Occultella glacieicola]TDE91499.1 hypothetical protein EXU48_15175 [Occultella glacieicola]
MTTMFDTTTHTDDPTIAAVRDAVGALAHAATLPRRPVPVAFLDDGRRLVLVVDAVRGEHTRIRSWGLEIRTDDDLIGDSQSVHLAVRSAQAPTADAAEVSARYLIAATDPAGHPA